MPIELVSGPHWLEIISWVCQILLTGLAFVAAYFAYVQVRQIESDSAQQLSNSHATLLLSIDARWEIDMREARNRFIKTREYVARVIEQNYPTVAPPDRQEKIANQWLTVMSQMRKSDTETYMLFIGICGF